MIQNGGDFMCRRKYFILSPSYSNDSVMEELRKKAVDYYGSENYQETMSDPLFYNIVKNNIFNGKNEGNASLLLIGIILMAMAQSDSVYVAKNWEEDDVCKICHMIAFAHGVDLIYESI